jgi:hypothetical protein
MATADDKRRELEEKINKLSGDTAKRFRDQLNLLVQQNAALSEFDDLLIDVNARVSAMSEGFGGVESQLKAIVDELKNVDSNSRDITKSFSGLRSISQKLKYDQQGITDLNLDQLKQEKSKVKILQEQLKFTADEVKKKIEAGEAITKQENALLQAEKLQYDVIQQINALLDARIEQEEEINKRLGITGTLLKGMSKIPIVGPLLKTNEALDAARTKAKSSNSAFKVMGAGLASVGKSLASSLMDPLATIGLVVAAFKFLLELGFKVDKQVVDLQKSLYLSRAGAEGLRENFQYISENNQVLVNGLNKQLLSVQSQVDAAMQLSNAMGAIGLATNEEVQSQILLTKQMGFSVEEANNLYVLGRQNKMTSAEVVGEVQKQVKAYQKQTGVLLDVKKITQDVSKITGQLRLQYGNNVNQLIAATVQANKLGFSLEKTKQIAEGLLNFEESIENELAAELLINRDLNLEQARLLALNGKSAEATALIADQMGGAAEFSKLNVIQQEALAKALNMSADELADSMLYQENLNRLRGEDRQRLKDQLTYLRSIGAEEQAQQLERAIANGTNIKASMDAVDAQTSFNGAVEKLKELLVDIVDGPAMRLANGLVEMLNTGEGLYRVILGVSTILGAMSIGKLVTGLVAAQIAAGGLAAMSAVTASALTLGVAALAIAGGVALIMNGANSAASTAEAKAKKPANSNFASGGIVGGNSIAGDNMTIKANSGEMVLNKSQQSKLFNLINGGGGGGNIQLNANLIMDDKVFALAVANVEKKYSNLVGTERQKANREPQ